ncbi:hypothetical protein HGI15_08545 [Modestobacter lapidis]|nr:hypothetical protein [Modestobacter lapidis]
MNPARSLSVGIGASCRGAHHEASPLTGPGGLVQSFPWVLPRLDPAVVGWPPGTTGTGLPASVDPLARPCWHEPAELPFLERPEGSS